MHAGPSDPQSRPDDTLPAESGGPGEAEGAASRGVVVLLHDGARVVRTGVEVSEPVSVGRDPACGVALHDQRASRVHAILSPGERGLVIEDLGSRNGTFVDGARIASREPLLLGRDAVVRVGQSLLLVTDDLQATARPFLDDGNLPGGGRLDQTRSQIHAVAGTALAVLIQGPTGSGKELVAWAIHRKSGRTGELVVVNCGAIAENLVEAELFGHARGAFSGAAQARTGLVRRAEGGTLFLDEVGELPPAAQAALLRFLERGEVRPVGDDTTRRVDVRVVTATHRDLDTMSESGAFRLDLLHRLAALRILLPPLAQRREDIPELSTRFAQGEQCTLSPASHEALLLAEFPGNVRQLKSAVVAGCVRARGEGTTVVRLEHLPVLSGRPADRGPPRPEPAASGGEESRTEALDRGTLEAELRKQRGNIARVARALGYSRSGLYVALRRHGLDPGQYRGDEGD